MTDNSLRAGDSKVVVVDGIEYAFRWCPPGTFLMGSPALEKDHRENETQHQVTLTRGFWMLETQVTQAMWQSVMNEDIRMKVKQACKDEGSVYGEGPNYPIYFVTWDECNDFCRKLSEKIGMDLALPTEAQWEYACRAGTTGNFAGEIDQMAKYGGTNEGAQAVALLKPNAWGLYDMHGNVYEWCQDWYGPYPGEPVTDPTGPEDGFCRVRRGGCWFFELWYCRSASRDFNLPYEPFCNQGFRPVGLVRSEEEQN